jgi:hypothetical protein
VTLVPALTVPASSVLGLGIVAILGVTGCDSLARHDSSAESAKQSADCMAHGMLAFDRWKARLAEGYDQRNGLLASPEFHFNKRLNTCLMKVGHWSFIPGTERLPGKQDSDLLNEVIDVYANKTLMSDGHANRWGPCRAEVLTCQGGDLTTTEVGLGDARLFEEQAKKLMTE